MARDSNWWWVGRWERREECVSGQGMVWNWSWGTKKTSTHLHVLYYVKDESKKTNKKQKPNKQTKNQPPSVRDEQEVMSSGESWVFITVCPSALLGSPVLRVCSEKRLRTEGFCWLATRGASKVGRRAGRWKLNRRYAELCRVQEDNRRMTCQSWLLGLEADDGEGVCVRGKWERWRPPAACLFSPARRKMIPPLVGVEGVSLLMLPGEM